MEIVKILDDIKNLPQLMRMAVGESIAEKTFTHEFSPPADPNSAAKILDFFGVEDKAFLEFYSYSNGVRLFHNETENDDTGKYFLPAVSLFPIDRLNIETDSFKQWFEHVDEHDRPIYATGLVIGEPTETGNHFVLILSGDLKGKIFFHDHDDCDWDDKPFAESLYDFLESLTYPPFKVLQQLHGTDWVEMNNPKSKTA